jgi:hypothetical protein
MEAQTGWGRNFRDAASQGATFDSVGRQVVRPGKKSLCNFDQRHENRRPHPDEEIDGLY